MLAPRLPLRLILSAALAVLATSCFKGDEREKAPPPGYAGGFCLAPTVAVPNPHCEDGSVCDLEGAYCYVPTDPCEGFFCGGSDRGVCSPDAQGKPQCACAPGYNNDMWPLFCCPDQGFDELCGAGVWDTPDETVYWTPAPQ